MKEENNRIFKFLNKEFLLLILKKTYEFLKKNIISVLKNIYTVLFSYFNFFVSSFWIWGMLLLNYFIIERICNDPNVEEQLRIWASSPTEQIRFTYIDIEDVLFINGFWYLIMFIAFTFGIYHIFKKIFIPQTSTFKLFKILISGYIALTLHFAFMYYAICYHNDRIFILENFNEYAFFYNRNLVYDSDKDGMCNFKFKEKDLNNFLEHKTKWKPTIDGIESSWLSFHRITDYMKFAPRDVKMKNIFKEKLEEEEKFLLIGTIYNDCSSEIKLDYKGSFGEIDSSKKIALFYDCIIYSAKVVSNLEIGSYSPNSNMVKFFTSIQAIIGVILFAFGLGLIFGQTQKTETT